MGYDSVKFIPTRWGNTPLGFLMDENEVELINNIIPSMDTKPDIFIQCTIPNEFQAAGKYNIGITAGTETTGILDTWVDGCNRMDLVLVSSNHSKVVFESAKYTKENGTTSRIETPISVLFEGLDINKYYKIEWID